MQRLTSLQRIGTTRFSRVLNLSQTRSVSNEKNLNDLYKPSTAKEETHVPDELHSGQPRETYEAPPKSTATLTGGGKVWSVQNPGSVHIAPLGAAATTVLPKSSADDRILHSTTAGTNKGPAAPIDNVKAEPTPIELAEAAAASAFEISPTSEPLSAASTEAVFAPKVSSTEVHSMTTSPTDRFDTVPSMTTSSTDRFDAIPSIPTESSTNQKSKEIPIQRESDIRDEILREALKFVEDKGWTLDAIRAGINSSNQPSTVEGLFSNGYDLVEYFILDANKKMVDYMNEKSKKGESQGTNLLIEGLKYRLNLVVPYAHNWDQALAQGALPQNAMRSWKNLLDLSSDAWHSIGDTSTDLNWYSKRLLLAAVYKSSEIYMLQDQSLDKIDTINFLERRLNDFQSFGSVRNTVSKSLSDTAQIVNGLFSVVRNLTTRR